MHMTAKLWNTKATTKSHSFRQQIVWNTKWFHSLANVMSHNYWSWRVLKSSKSKRKTRYLRALQFYFTLSTKPIRVGAMTVVVDATWNIKNLFKLNARIVNYHGLLTPITFTMCNISRLLLFISISSPICQSKWNLSGLFRAFRWGHKKHDFRCLRPLYFVSYSHICRHLLGFIF